MTWTTAKRRVASHHAGACTISSSDKGSVRFILHHDDNAGPLPAWFKPGGKIKLLVGQGEDYGHIRLVEATPTDRYRWPIGATPRGSVLMISIVGGWDGAPGVRIAKQPVDYDYTDEWFDVTLPEDWLDPAKTARVKPSQGASQPALSTEIKKDFGITHSVKPFKMITSLARGGELIKHD